MGRMDGDGNGLGLVGRGFSPDTTGDRPALFMIQGGATRRGVLL